MVVVGEDANAIADVGGGGARMMSSPMASMVQVESSVQAGGACVGVFCFFNERCCSRLFHLRKERLF
jgi:hypothetical protein